MRKFGLALALASTIALTFGTSHADTTSATYIATGVAATGVVTSPRPGVGTAFLPEAENAKIPTKIRVADAAGLTGFSVDVCQNTDPDDASCFSDDATFSYCSTGQTVNIPSSIGFNNVETTIVFVNPDNRTAIKPCAANGHTLAGTITLTRSG